MIGERTRLELHAYPALHAGGIPEHVDAGDHGRPSVGAAQSFEDLDCRGLPRSVRTEKAEDLTWLDEKADAADRFDLAVALAQVGDLHDGRHDPNASDSRRTRRRRDRERRTRRGGERPRPPRYARRWGSVDEAACR